MERSIDQGKVKRLIAKGAVVVIAAAAALPALAVIATNSAEAKPGNGNSGQAEYGTLTGQDRALTNPGADNRSPVATEQLEGSGDPGGDQENAANNPGSDNRSANAQEQLASE